MFTGYDEDDSMVENKNLLKEQTDTLDDDNERNVGNGGPRLNSPRNSTPPSEYLALLGILSAPTQRSPRERSPEFSEPRPSSPARTLRPPPGIRSMGTLPSYSPPPGEKDDEIRNTSEPPKNILTTLVRKRLQRELESSSGPSTLDHNKRLNQEDQVMEKAGIEPEAGPSQQSTNDKDRNDAGPSHHSSSEIDAMEIDGIVNMLQDIVVANSTVNPRDLHINGDPFVQQTDDIPPPPDDGEDVDMALAEKDQPVPENPVPTVEKRQEDEGHDGGARSITDSTTINQNGKRTASPTLTAPETTGKRPTHGGKVPRKTVAIKTTKSKTKRPRGKGCILIADPGDVIADFAHIMSLEEEDVEVPGEIEVRGEFCSSCSDVGNLVRCTAENCPVYMCIGEEEGTSCLRPSEYEGTSWRCRHHNIPTVAKYHILSQNTGQLDFGRTLVPLLYLRINLTSTVHNAKADTIKRHLMDIYAAHGTLLHTFAVNFSETFNFSDLQNAVMTWLALYPKCAILVVLEAEIHRPTGEMVYQAPGGASYRRSAAKSILTLLFGRSYDKIFCSGLRGQRGLIALQGGAGLKVDSSWEDLVQMGNVDWILGFGAEELRTTKLYFTLHHFVEMIFLREADAQGFLLTPDDSIPREEKYRFLDSIKRTLCLKELLVYTALVAIYIPPGKQSPVVEELVHSSPMALWGFPLPSCPRCGNHNVRASTGQHDRRGKPVLAIVRCLGCRYRTKGNGIKRPQALKIIQPYNSAGDEFYWKPAVMDSPWLGHEWRTKGKTQ